MRDLRGEEEEHLPDEDPDELDVIMDRIDQGYAPAEAADLERNSLSFMDIHSLPTISRNTTRPQSDRKDSRSRSGQSSKKEPNKDEKSEGSRSDEQESEDKEGVSKDQGRENSRKEVSDEKIRAFKGLGKQLLSRDFSGLDDSGKLNIVSLNVAGARFAKESPMDFVAEALALMSRLDAQVLCLQDFNLVRDSWAMDCIFSQLGKVGISVTASIRCKSSGCKDSELRDTAMGVCIFSPSAITVKSSRRMDESCMWTSVDMVVSPEQSIRIFSIYAPPGGKNSKIRNEINLAILPHLNCSDLMVVVAGDMNEVINPELDSSSRTPRKLPNSTLKFIQKKTQMVEAFRFCNPCEKQAFSRVEAKMVKGRFQFSASRIDMFLVCNNIIFNNLLVATGIDSEQKHLPSDHFPVWLSLGNDQWGFKRIQLFEGTGLRDPNWRKINEAVIEKIKCESKNQKASKETDELIEAFNEELQKESKIFCDAMVELNMQTSIFSQTKIATAEMRRILDEQSRLIHEATYNAAANTERKLKLSKGKGKEDEKAGSSLNHTAKKKSKVKPKISISSEFASCKKRLFSTLNDIRREYLSTRRIFALVTSFRANDEEN